MADEIRQGTVLGRSERLLTARHCRLEQYGPESIAVRIIQHLLSNCPSRIETVFVKRRETSMRAFPQPARAASNSDSVIDIVLRLSLPVGWVCWQGSHIDDDHQRRGCAHAVHGVPPVTISTRRVRDARLADVLRSPEGHYQTLPSASADVFRLAGAERTNFSGSHQRSAMAVKLG